MSESNRSIISGAQILIDNKWVLDQALVLENSVIKAIIPEQMIKHHLPAHHEHFSKEDYLIPGLIDLHVHGANGNDVMDGTACALSVISQALAMEGVTGFLATTMTAKNETIELALSAIPSAMQEKTGAAVLGVHLEGPFIAEKKMGAQQGDLAQLPNVSLVKKWQQISQNAIKLVTLAPELKGALDLIELLKELHIIVSVGHTNATYAETEAAISAGCTYATHLFNAMSGIHQRAPGAAGALLLAQDVIAELIVDGMHLHPAMVELAYRVKGKDHLLLVSDAMRAKCLGDGSYELGGQQVLVNNGKASLADGTLAGSTLRLPHAIKNMVKYSSCTLEDAIAMASYNPAHTLGLHNTKGSIAVGKDADLVVLDAKFNAILTMRGGQIVFKHEAYA